MGMFGCLDATHRFPIYWPIRMVRTQKMYWKCTVLDRILAVKEYTMSSLFSVVMRKQYGIHQVVNSTYCWKMSICITANL